VERKVEALQAELKQAQVALQNLNWQVLQEQQVLQEAQEQLAVQQVGSQAVLCLALLCFAELPVLQGVYRFSLLMRLTDCSPLLLQLCTMCTPADHIPCPACSQPIPCPLRPPISRHATRQPAAVRQQRQQRQQQRPHLHSSSSRRLTQVQQLVPSPRLWRMLGAVP
jgi:hypothetical protein